MSTLIDIQGTCPAVGAARLRTGSFAPAAWYATTGASELTIAIAMANVKPSAATSPVKRHDGTHTGRPSEPPT